MKIPFHEAADIFPLMSDADFNQLVEDIKEHGQQVPIEILNNEIIDGRNRYNACKKLGIEPDRMTVYTDDPVAYVCSRNLYRRHLSESQRAMIGARIKGIYEKAAHDRMVEGKGDDGSGGRGHKANSKANLPEGLDKGQARDKAAEAVNVGGRSIDYASTVLRKGTPALVKAVEDNRMSVSYASLLTQESEETQNEVAKNARKKKRNKDIKGTDGRPQGGNLATEAMQIATIAISQLTRIRADDPKREEAFIKVEQYIQKARGEK